MSSELKPLRLAPVLVERPWGGSRLARLGKAVPTSRQIGESWEVADLPAQVAPHVVDPRSRVASGPLAGASLADLIARHGADLLGSAPSTEEGDFPLLVKLLDAREHLSVQVHPHAEYVDHHPHVRVKTESWYVVEAEPGAHLFLDARSGVTRAEIVDALGSPELVELLRRVPAIAGEFHHLPAGLIHALGAGIVVAEIQTPSDTTFRMYDWTEEYAREPRPLHLAEAAETITLDPPDASHLPASTEPGARELERNNRYWITEHWIPGGLVELDPAPEVRILMVLSGTLRVGAEEASAGSTFVIPAQSMPTIEVRASGQVVALEIGLAPARPTTDSTDI